MIVTKAPSEPLSLVKKTLLGMLSQKYPHDTWVADEDPTEEAISWYRKNNIKVSCRKDDPAYHNETWPRRKKCKEGNLSYFYDKFGYKKYDVVAQLDADHIPGHDYLENMLRPFANKRIGYVAAPSLCNANFSNSWSSRARGHSESTFHGPIQGGANSNWVPLCIGSNYAVRTKALKAIGGIGPELAEDYSTTLFMIAHGWKGVWSGQAVAQGIGPNSFNDLIVQDFQWAKSLFTLMISFFPKYWKMIGFREKIQFLFTQLWYPASGIAWFVSISLPIIALISGKALVNVDFLQFILHAFPLIVVSYAVFIYTRINQNLRPQNIKLFSWENMLFELARLPWVLIACISALTTYVSNKYSVNKVTPKSKNDFDTVGIWVLSPYVFIVGICLISMYIAGYNEQTYGYFWFAAVTAFSYTALLFVVVILQIVENGKYYFRQFQLHSIQIIITVFLSITGVYIVNDDLTEVYARANSQIINFIYPDNTFANLNDTFDEVVLTNEDMVTDAHITYTVEKGDSLWKIAEEYYGDGFKWIDIKRNRGSTIIYPGEILLIPNEKIMEIS